MANSPLPILTRAATLTDLPTLLAFEQGIIQTERPFDPTLKADPINYYDLRQLVQSEEAEVVVATIDNEVVASGYARKLPGKPYHRYEFYAYLGFMFVKPEHRGKGLIQKILDDLLKWSKEQGLSEIRLEVYVDNPAAVRAYEKAGFKQHTLWMRKEV